MLRYFIKLTFRSTVQNKFLSLLNIGGLLVAMTTALFIVQYMVNELSFDDFHKDGDSIYRAVWEMHREGEVSKRSGIMTSLPIVLKEREPAIESYVRVLKSENFFDYENNTFRFPYIITESTFFDFFNFNLISGDYSDLASKKDIAFVDTEVVETFFEPGAEYLGEKITLGKRELIIAGVFEPLPKNTHFEAKVIMPFSGLPSSYNVFPNQDDSECYFRIKNPESTESAFKTMNDLLREAEFGIYDEKDQYGAIYGLQALSDIRLKSFDYSGSDASDGNYQLFIFLGVFAVCILAMSWFNYINLSLANAMKRGKELGIKRILGAGKWQISAQFVAETFILLIMAIVGSIVLLKFFTGKLDELFSLSFFSILEHVQLLAYWPSLVFLGLVVLSTLFTGLYVGGIMNSLKPVDSLKGIVGGVKKSFAFKKSLVVIQFIVASFAITFSFLIQNQLKFVLNKDLGLDLDDILVFQQDITTSRSVSSRVFFNKAESYSFVKDISVAASVPGIRGGGARSISSTTTENGEKVFHKPVSHVFIDERYVDLFSINLIAGRNFNLNEKNEKAKIINSGYANDLGYSDPADAIGHKLGTKGEVIGVIEDYHTMSLRKDMDNIMMEYQLPTKRAKYAMKIEKGKMKEAIAILSQDWKETFDTTIAEPVILKEKVNSEYASDQNLLKLIRMLTVITLLISISGLVGITHLSVVHRMKEIGLRKILGANWSNVMMVFSRGYFLLLILSFIIAVPLSLQVYQTWLQGFAYRISLDTTMLVVPVALVFGIAMIILFYQSTRSFKMRPLDTLRKE